MSSTVGSPTPKVTYPLSKIGISKRFTSEGIVVLLTKRCAINDGYRHISVILTMSEQDVEHYHGPSCPWSGPGVKRWRGEGEAYSSASIPSSIIYKLAKAKLSSSGTSLWKERPDGVTALCAYDNWIRKIKILRVERG
jgi:hypothetical protein